MKPETRKKYGRTAVRPYGQKRETQNMVHGMTLIELMIAMALSAIVAGTIVFIVATANMLLRRSLNISDAVQQNQTILGRIKKELEEATKIYSAEAPYIAIYRNKYSLSPLPASVESKSTSDNPEDLPWQVDDPVNGPFWVGIKDDIVVYYYSKTPQGIGAVYREVRDGYNPSTLRQGPTVISDPSIEVDHLKFTYFNYTMQWPEYLPFRYTGSTVWNSGGAVYTQYAKIPPYTRNVKVVISPGNYPQNKWNNLSGTRGGVPVLENTTLTMQSRTVTPAQIWWDDDLPAGASWNSYADVFNICTVGTCSGVDAVVNGPDGRQNLADASRPGLTWRTMPYDDPWAYSGLKFDSGAAPGPRMAYAQTEDFVPDYPNPYQKIHMHYFTGGAALPAGGPFANTDTTYIFVHAYVNPSPIDFTKEIMVMLHCNDATHCTGGPTSLNYWKHRAFWTSKELLRFDNQNDKDENNNGSSIDDGLIPWGITGIDRGYMGEIPQAGTWVVLGIPVKKAGVNLAGRQITGMAFALYGGQVHWDRASYGTWGAWTNTPGDVAEVPGADITFNTAIPGALANNYYQWRTYMKRPEADETVTPVLKDVTLNYGSDLTFTSAAFPQTTVYSATQNWLATTEGEFNRSKDKKSTSANPDGTITLSRPKCYEFQATNRLDYDLNNYPVVVSANTFNEVLEGDMRGDGNDIRVYRKADFDNKCITYPNTTANLPAPAGCAGTETAFKTSGRRFGTGQTNVAFLDNVIKDNAGTPAVNEGQFNYYMCYGDLTDNTGYWVLPANHTAAVNGTAVNEPYLPPTKFSATKDLCETGFWTCLGNFFLDLVSCIFSLNIPCITGAWSTFWTCADCWWGGVIPKYHPTNPVESSYNFGGVPNSGYTNTYYDPTGATTQYIFTSYGGLTRYDDFTYDTPKTSYRDDIAALYHFFDSPEDSLGAIPNVTGHILPHGIYNVTTNKYFYIATAGEIGGGCNGSGAGGRLIAQCDAATTSSFDATGGPVACGGAGNVQATLRNAGRQDTTPTWWEVISDRPLLGIQLFGVRSAGTFGGGCYNIPEDVVETLENEDYYRGLIVHPGTYTAVDTVQGLRTPDPVLTVSAAFPANGGNLWAYSLGVYDHPTVYDYYEYFVDEVPERVTPVSTKVGKWDEIPSSSFDWLFFPTCDPSQTTNSAVGLPWGNGGASAQACCVGCRGEMAGWVWMDLGVGGKTFDRIEMQWGRSSPELNQEIWAMTDNAAATACYASMIDTEASTDGLMSGCAGAGATQLATNGFILGGGNNACTFSYDNGMECGFDSRFGTPAYYALFLPIGTGNNARYDYVKFKTPLTYRYIGISGKTYGQPPLLGLLQPSWSTAMDFEDVRIWNKSSALDYNGAALPNPTGYEVKDIGGAEKYEWYQALPPWLGGSLFRNASRNHGFAYFLNKPVSGGATHKAAIKQLRKLEIGCYDYTMIPLLGFVGYGCRLGPSNGQGSQADDDGRDQNRGILLAAGGAMYQPPLVTPAKPLGWLNPVALGFTKLASDTAAGSSPDRARDNDMGTYWQSLNNITAATNPRLYMDMGSDRKINMIVVYPSFVEGNGYKYSVSVAKSADCPGGCDLCPATAWVQIGMKADMQPSSEGGDIFSFAPQSVRCVMEEFLDGSKGGPAGAPPPTWWASGGTAGDTPAKVLEQEAYLAKYEKEGFYNSPPFVGDSHRSWTIPFTKDAYDVRLHFVKFDPHSADDYVTVWDTVTNEVLWSQLPNPPVTAAQINQTKCTVGAGNAPEAGDPGTQFWTPWLRSCLNSAGAYDPVNCKCYDEAATNTNASTKVPGQQIKLYWTGPLGYDITKQGWVIDKYQIWGIINPALIQVEMESCSGKLKSERCVSAVTKVQPSNLMYQTRLKSVLK